MLHKVRYYLFLLFVDSGQPLLHLAWESTVRDTVFFRGAVPIRCCPLSYTMSNFQVFDRQALLHTKGFQVIEGGRIVGVRLPCPTCKSNDHTTWSSWSDVSRLCLTFWEHFVGYPCHDLQHIFWYVQSDRREMCLHLLLVRAVCTLLFCVFSRSEQFTVSLARMLY